MTHSKTYSSEYEY